MKYPSTLSVTNTWSQKTWLSHPLIGENRLGRVGLCKV